jgi:hypothetical protein
MLRLQDKKQKFLLLAEPNWLHQQSATLGTALNLGTTSAGRAATLAVSDTTKYVLGVYVTAPGGNGEICTAIINCANPTRAI